MRPVSDPRPERSPVDEIIDLGGRDLLDEGDPTAAEMWASRVLHIFERSREQARLEGTEVPPFEEALLQQCRVRGDRNAAVVAAALASVIPPAHERLAASVASELAGVVRLPGWVSAMGRVTPTRGWIASDVFGDVELLITGFRQEGQTGEHALAVLVDHNLSGQAKDIRVSGDLDDVVASWSSTVDPHTRLVEAPLDTLLPRLRNAMAMSDRWNGDTELRTEDFAWYRALTWARLRRAGVSDEGSADDEVTQAERRLLVTEFLASAAGRAVASELPGTDVGVLAHELVELRSDYESRPLRWSPSLVSLLLYDLAPRQLLLDSDQAAAFPAVLRAFVRFSAERTGLEPAFVEEILATVDETEPAFLERIGDPATAGPAKAALLSLQARGVDLDDVDAINEALEQGSPIRLQRSAPKKKPRPTTAPEDVIASAERAAVLARFEVLTDFYGDGRKLTQTGRPTLADAKELVSLLGTRDRIDPTIGARTFKTTSAADLPELSFMIRWALEAGALRKEHGKLKATKAWEKLGRNPLQRWMKAADALQTLGPLAAFHAGSRYRDPDEILDELAPQILYRLEDRPAPFDEVLDWVCEEADLTYEWLAPYLQDPARRRTSFGYDLELFLRILGWAGIVDRVGAKVEHDRYDIERLVGGTVQLTPAGYWYQAER